MKADCSTWLTDRDSHDSGKITDCSCQGEAAALQGYGQGKLRVEKAAGGAGQAPLTAPAPSRLGEPAPSFVGITPGTGEGRQTQGNISLPD